MGTDKENAFEELSALVLGVSMGLITQGVDPSQAASLAYMTVIGTLAGLTECESTIAELLAVEASDAPETREYGF